MYESPSIKFQQEWFKEELNSMLWDLKTTDKEFAEALNEPVMVPTYKKVLKRGAYI
jgi:predicted transcriptional regulator